jgi:mRNA-degrading endonuclease RelE of RelBE toxin-antitoxin system
VPERTLKVPGVVRKVLQHLHPEIKRRIRAGLVDILPDPSCGKPLKADLDGLSSLRIGRYRIIYRADAAGAEIVAIGPRATIYEETARLSRRGQR